MVDELKEMGIELMVSIWPTSNPKSENYAYMDERNMILRTENGLYGMQDFYGQQDYIDTLNPKARDYMWSLVKKNYYSQGIKYFWLDEAEPGMTPNHYDNIRCHLGNFEEYALLYPYYYEKLFYEGLEKEGETDIITLARAGYMGSQRYGALLWSGDVPSTFEALHKSVRTGLAMAMSGIPWWTTDIGGFWGGDAASEEFRELIVRWFQFGVFCPVTRLHGVRVKPEGHIDRHPGINEMSGGDNEIWSYGERNYKILRELVELRERLRPYIMHYMNKAKETGVSIMRPLFMEYPVDEECYAIEDEYLFGEDILFAPITEKGVRDRMVYLPEGRWVRTVGREKIEGGQWVQAHAEIDEFIAFVRLGADVLNVF
jgi:alpha-D-xyloside xylohydrolase